MHGTVDAQYLAGYEFRVTDGGAPLAENATAVVLFGAKPPLLLSPGQRDGLDVDDPLTPAQASLVSYPLAKPDSPIDQPIDAIATTATATAGPQRYALVAMVPTEKGATYGLTAPFESPHDPYTALASDACAGCHGTHTAKGPELLLKAAPQSNVCFTCHDSAGTGATARVQAEYTNPAVPANDPATRSYYRHDALAPNSGHTLATNDEFGGRSDRHSECADCHQPHLATDAPGTMTTEGWTIPGALEGISGVKVTNGAAGTAPAYTFLEGGATSPTLEYQLCFKCHSGTTVLPSNTGFTPSKYTLDKAIEFNPGQRLLPPDRGGRHEPDHARWPPASPARRRSSSGTSPRRARSAA